MKYKTGWVRLLREIMFIKGHIFVSQASSRLLWTKKNESQMSQWGVVNSPATGVSLHWGGGSHAAAYPIPPSPKTNKVFDTDQAPVGAPAPAFVRAPGHNANCDQETASLIKHWDTSEAECSYFIQAVDGLRVFNCRIGCVGELMQIIWVLENMQTHMHICSAEDKQNVWACGGKQRFLTAVLNYVREVNTQEVGLKQQSVNIILEHSPWNTRKNEGLEVLSGAPNRPSFQHHWWWNFTKTQNLLRRGNNFTFLEFPELSYFICSVWGGLNVSRHHVHSNKRGP